jgi:hypothetical protein
LCWSLSACTEWDETTRFEGRVSAYCDSIKPAKIGFSNPKYVAFTLPIFALIFYSIPFLAYGPVFCRIHKAVKQDLLPEENGEINKEDEQNYKNFSWEFWRLALLLEGFIAFRIIVYAYLVYARDPWTIQASKYLTIFSEVLLCCHWLCVDY